MLVWLYDERYIVMSTSFQIDNKTMKVVSTAAAAVGYSSDYVTKLARDKKINAVQVGRQWFVDESSLQAYVEQSIAEQKIRQQQLSKARKVERGKRVPKKMTGADHVRKQQPAIAAMACIGIASILSVITFFPSTPKIFDGAQIVAATQSLDFKETHDGYEIAVGTTVEPQALPVEFSHTSIQTMTGSSSLQQGVLLLPQSGVTSTSTIEQMFSDDIKILTDERGVTYVARVNEFNEVISKIPFVVVPVEGM